MTPERLTEVERFVRAFRFAAARYPAQRTGQLLYNAFRAWEEHGTRPDGLAFVGVDIFSVPEEHLLHALEAYADPPEEEAP